MAIDFYNDFFGNSYTTIFSECRNAIFSPDSVAGYPAHYQEPDFDRHWFSSTTIVSRYKLIESLIAGRNKIFPNAPIFSQIDMVSFLENHIETQVIFQMWFRISYFTLS